ncbi:MAG: hypothetical protein EBZ48_12065, partial [Proteobacteria bacterium]|nr:hypothetical protein [Pseudomonadota bacterium]
MTVLIVTLLALLGLGTLVVAAMAFGVSIPGLSGGRPGVRANLQNLSGAQRRQTESSQLFGAKPGRRPNGAVLETAPKKVSSSKITLEKRLKYAQWSIPPTVYYFCAAGVSLFLFTICFLKFNIVFQGLSLLAGPVFMGWLLNLRVHARFKEFDADYPQFLLSVVSLLKTGMNVMSALESSAKGLEEYSLTRSEVELMIERLRYGVSEDKSIGAFGEDIYHPEIELFVQALLLSRRV